MSDNEKEFSVEEIYKKYCDICYPNLHTEEGHKEALRKYREYQRKRIENVRNEMCSCPCHSSSFTGMSGSFHCMGGPCCSKPNVRKTGGCGY